MRLQHRSIKGQALRPSPIVSSMEGELIVVATPWGDPSAAKKAVQNIEEFMHMTEAELSTEVAVLERLRAAFLATNEMIYLSHNRVEYQTALELLAIHYHHGVLTWTQVGSPNLNLQLGHRTLPLTVSLEWSFQTQQLSPLPSQVLGIDKNPILQSGTCRVTAGNQLVLLSSSVIPEDFFRYQASDFETMVRFIHQQNVGQPFWLGLIDLY